MVGPKMQAFFCPRIDLHKGNRFILRIWGASVPQKLGMILEKSGSKIEVRKINVFLQKLPGLF